MDLLLFNLMLIITTMSYSTCNDKQSIDHMKFPKLLKKFLEAHRKHKDAPLPQRNLQKICSFVVMYKNENKKSKHTQTNKQNMMGCETEIIHLIQNLAWNGHIKTSCIIVTIMELKL